MQWVVRVWAVVYLDSSFQSPLVGSFS